MMNYLWQLRPYSYADLILMLLAIGANAWNIVIASFLWFGFLVHLEWRHRDVGRRLWRWEVWGALWMAAIITFTVVGHRSLPGYLSLVCAILFAVCYALKKRSTTVGVSSWLISGSNKAAIAAGIP